MTNEELKAEFNRWIDAGRPKVWIKDLCYPDSEWLVINLAPKWSTANVYIVDDEQAEVRKAYYDNPNLTIEYKLKVGVKWYEAFKPAFDEPNCEYRIKPKFKIGDKLKKKNGNTEFIVDMICKDGYMQRKFTAILFKDEDEWELVKEPTIERRWRWARDYEDYTIVLPNYLSNEYIAKNKEFENMYKLENDYIDITIKS